MRICHVINNLHVGGAETMLHKLLSRLKDTGIESEVVSLIEIGMFGVDLGRLAPPGRFPVDLYHRVISRLLVLAPR